MKLLIADAAISLVPKNWLKDASISEYYQKTGRIPLRNGSKHQHLLKNISVSQRQDRPDILHFGLLTALGYTKLIKGLEIYFSCNTDLYWVDPNTRLPRSQSRFYGLLESILSNNYQGNLIQKIDSGIKLLSNRRVLFSSKGKQVEADFIDKNELFIFGGFSSGGFSTLWGESQELSLSSQKLDLWTAISIFLNKIV